MRNAQIILRHINVSVHDGTALVLTGANGSGKTTLLRMLAGFSRPSGGEILWNGHDITSAGVFQQYKLQLNWLSLKDAINDKLSVLDNVQWFEVLEGKCGRSLPALELMGIGRLANDKARMLSMGQRKRLQLARLLALDRPIWLLDEPSVALDDEGVRLLEYIIAEHRKKGGIVFVATHLPIQIEDAMSLRLPPRFPRRMTFFDMGVFGRGLSQGEIKMKSKKINDCLNRFHVAAPKPRDTKGRLPCIPQALLEAITKANEMEKRKLEKDLEEENGGAGVYSANLRKHYLLVHEEWKEDDTAEILDGHNVYDFVDPDILQRLEELERDGGLRLEGEAAEEDFEMNRNELTEEEQAPCRDQKKEEIAYPRT
ncbi:hypothetical protein ZIOFF_058070 [Zingiber officinale]|uniref:ABC transporter domain-containing protein n=1 Tax=Zingiber officinale TaxID=94328 RepID=A0A8J5F4C9_ZINOF|nr:hypothetical protein ZIOFF_058070 [Zingiber officinale]